MMITIVGMITYLLYIKCSIYLCYNIGSYRQQGCQSKMNVFEWKAVTSLPGPIIGNSVNAKCIWNGQNHNTSITI